MNETSIGNPASSEPDPGRLSAMAAVRLTFDPQDLLDQWRAQFPQASLDQQQQANDVLFDLLEVAAPMMNGDGQPAWSLPEPERAALLDKLDVGTAQGLLATIPAQQRGPTEQLFSSVLAGVPVELGSDSAQLSTVQTVSRWATAIGVAGVPAPEQVGARLRHLDFLQTLGGTDLPSFVGRSEILERLHALWRQPGESLTGVALEGPGGIGKSLTVTRFIATLLEGDPADCPNAIFHLDFDRLVLQRAQPTTILRELIRQSRAWCDPDDVDTLSELAHNVSSAGPGPEMASEGLRSSLHQDMHPVAARLLELIADGPPARIIMFVDSVEQVDGVDDVAAASPEQVAHVLADAGARVLLIYASRTFRHMNLAWTTHLMLDQLTVQEATDYLKKQAARVGLAITDAQAEAVQRAAGRSPLGLRLAVALLEKGDHVDGTVPWDVQVERSPEFLQAALYERLLRRLRNEELRKIAAPGLLVRRVTKDLIQEVLAGPCKLDLQRTSPAALMQAAEREGQLFTHREGDPDALWHRRDVRATMLENVRRFAGEALAREIHQLAIAYYMRDASPIARTEELYHRLCLSQDQHLLDARWDAAAGLALRPAIDELPPAAQAYLRARYGAATDAVPPPSNLSAEAQDAEFDLLTRKRLLADGPTGAVLQRWEAAGRRLDGRNGDLLAATLVRNGQHEDMLHGALALFVVSPEQLVHKPASGVLRIAGGVLEGRGVLDQAEKYWKEAVSHARWAADELGELAALVGAVRTVRKLGGDGAAALAERHRALRLVARLSPGLIAHKVVAREAGAELVRSPAPDSVAAAIHPSIVKLLEDVIGSNEAFPSAANDPARIAELSARLLGSQANISIRNLNSVALRLLRARDGLGPLIATLREEVDLSLARAAWPAAVAGP